MELKLPTGATITGTESEVRAIATALGFGGLLARENDGVHYRSSTHGLMRIAEMNTRHLVNAIRKLYRAEADALPVDRVNLVNTLINGVGSKNVTLLALIKELKTRRD